MGFSVNLCVRIASSSSFLSVATSANDPTITTLLAIFRVALVSVCLSVVGLLPVRSLRHAALPVLILGLC
jgi:hypothetical protein